MSAPDTVSPPRAPELRPLLPRLRNWWAGRSPLARDITIVLLVKAVALWILWYAFFRAPVAPHMVMDPGRVAARLASPAPSTETPHAVP